MQIFEPTFYFSVVGTMMVLAIVVFFALQRISAGYGMMYKSGWGPTMGNRPGWFVMECPVVIAMVLMWIFSPRALNPAPAVMASIFLLHYLQRTFVFPFLIRGRSRMPIAIIAMGATFNIINAYMIGGWLFYVAPDDMYTVAWLRGPLFVAGVIIFVAGMLINIHSDNIIRHLRKSGDTRHYIPRGGMFRYVTSANYLGEFTEWLGYAILTWSLGALAFAMWTFANLAPRARAIHKRYLDEFGEEYSSLHRRHILPFLY